MNPSLKFFLAIIISLEVSFKASLETNLIIIGFSMLYLIYHRIKWQSFLLLLVVPILAAVAMLTSVWGEDVNYAWMLFTRIYVFVFVGACVTQTTTIDELVRSLEQNFKLPSKFAYGILAAFNVIPRIKEEVQRIKVAGEMRGVYLSFWSPRLYFKAILAALNWSDGLAQGMLSHGYRENRPRSVILPIALTRRDWLIFVTILLVLQVIIFL